MWYVENGAKETLETFDSIEKALAYIDNEKLEPQKFYKFTIYYKDSGAPQEKNIFDEPFDGHPDS